MERGSVLHMFSIASSRSEQTRTTLPPSLLSLSSLSLFSSSFLSTPSMPTKTAYNVTADELFSLRGSFSFKKSASYFPGMYPCLVCRKKLHARILLYPRNERSYLRIQSRGYMLSLPSKLYPVSLQLPSNHPISADAFFHTPSTPK